MKKLMKAMKDFFERYRKSVVKPETEEEAFERQTFGF